jgi:hypothetical protein
VARIEALHVSRRRRTASIPEGAKTSEDAHAKSMITFERDEFQSLITSLCSAIMLPEGIVQRSIRLI